MGLDPTEFTKMTKFLIPANIITACFYGCDANQNAETGNAQMTGADRDEHGCIASAGYQWCERSGQCERPWELAEKEGFENTPEQFDAFCSER